MSAELRKMIWRHENRIAELEDENTYYRDCMTNAIRALEKLGNTEQVQAMQKAIHTTPKVKRDNKTQVYGQIKGDENER
jgi:hypothetical protein